MFIYCTSKFSAIAVHKNSRRDFDRLPLYETLGPEIRGEQAKIEPLIIPFQHNRIIPVELDGGFVMVSYGEGGRGAHRVIQKFLQVE
jgi:hypothetical protein